MREVSVLWLAVLGALSVAVGWGVSGLYPMDIVNLKCDPILIGSLRAEPGFYPAYHMNKENWITAALDGSAPEDKLRLVLDMSYNATAPKLRKKKA